MLGGQVAETDVEICLDRLAVSLFLPNSAGVGFGQHTRESRMSLFVFRRGLGSLHLNPGVEIISTPGFFFAPTRDHTPETA